MVAAAGRRRRPVRLQVARLLQAGSFVLKNCLPLCRHSRGLPGKLGVAFRCFAPRVRSRLLSLSFLCFRIVDTAAISQRSGNGKTPFVCFAGRPFSPAAVGLLVLFAVRSSPLYPVMKPAPSPVRSEDESQEQLSLLDGAYSPPGRPMQQCISMVECRQVPHRSDRGLHHPPSSAPAPPAGPPPPPACLSASPSCAPADDATDILEAANQVQLNDRREGQHQAKVDADFFNRFDDDADESDMRPAA